MCTKGEFWQNSNIRKGIVFAVFSFLTVCIIFSQSLLSMEESGDLSAGLAAFLRPILDPGGVLSEDSFHHYLRKAAHFTEFAVLGLLFSSFCVSIGRYMNKRLVSLSFLVPLCIAVCDEFIQYFAGRGSMVTDVVIDFSGSVLAILIVLIITNRKLPH